MIDSEPGLLRRTWDFFFPPAVSTLVEFRTFVSGEAAYLAQKTVIGYCRVKTMHDYEKLLTEAAFRDGLEVCRWEAYAGTLGDTLILTEGMLRPADERTRARLAAAVAALYPDLLDESCPPHRSDWQDRKEAFARRFALSRQAEPAQPDHVVEGTAALIHELAPIHDEQKKPGGKKSKQRKPAPNQPPEEPQHIDVTG